MKHAAASTSALSSQRPLLTRWFEDDAVAERPAPGTACGAAFAPATLPVKQSSQPVRPWVPMTIKSILFSSANRSICSAGSPSTTTCSTGIDEPGGRHDLLDLSMSRWR